MMVCRLWSDTVFTSASVVDSQRFAHLVIIGCAPPHYVLPVPLPLRHQSPLALGPAPMTLHLDRTSVKITNHTYPLQPTHAW